MGNFSQIWTEITILSAKWTVLHFDNFCCKQMPLPLQSSFEREREMRMSFV